MRRLFPTRLLPSSLSSSRPRRIPGRLLLGLLTLGWATAWSQAPLVDPLAASLSVGSSILVTVTIPVTTAGTAGSVTGLTGGVANLDFTVQSGGTCAAGTSYTAGQQCTAVVQFAPKYPGVRRGAIVLQTSSGALLGTAFLNGHASGALPVLVPGRIDTIAGSGPWIYSGDGVAATSASIFTPQGIALDPAGNLFLADTGNNRIRRVDATSGNITTVAGNNTQTYGGDGGPASSASLAAPSGLALDGAGNLYFADMLNHVVRRIDAFSGWITTVAGTPLTAGYSGDNGPATQALLNLPVSVALDNSGNLLISEQGNHTIRHVDLQTGTITTLGGVGAPGFNGDNQPATATRLNNPIGMLPIADGSLLFADSANHRVRRIGTDGTVTTFAGTGVKGFSGDGGTASQATLNNPSALAVDPFGDVYIADSGNNRIRLVHQQTNFIETAAGTDSTAFAGDGGPDVQASLYGPSALVFSQNGDLLLSDMFHMRIRRVSGSTNRLTFPTIRRGKVSGYQNQLLANLGDAPLQVGTPALNLAALDAAGTTCTNTAVVQPSNACLLEIEFAATIPEAGFASGTDYVGSVTLPSNALNVTPVVTIDAVVLDVNPTSITVTSSANPSVVGASVTFAATVTSDDTGRSGTVTFTADGNTLCTGNLAGNGTASCSTSSLALGSHSIIAQYSGDAQNAAATSTTLTEVVKQQATLALTSSANPVVVTAPVTFTVVASAATGTPSGAVTFVDGSTSLGTANLSSGQATVTVDTLTVGAHSITVQYAGDTQNAPSTSAALTETVQPAGTTTTLSTGNADVPVGTAITLSTIVTSSNGATPTGNVSFMEGNTSYGLAALQPNGTAAVTFNTLPPGVHTLTARYIGDTNNSPSTSGPLTETVRQLSTTTTLTADNNPLSAGAVLHLTAQVAMAAGTTPDGNLFGQIVFQDGGATLATMPLSGSAAASLELHNTTVGTHTFTAVYQGNTNYAGSTGTLSETVSHTATTVILTSAASPTLAGLPVVLTVGVTSSTAIPTGSVSVSDAGTVIGTATLNASGNATLSPSTLAAGTHTLIATYAGDANYLTSASSPLNQVVNKAVVTVTLTGPSAPVNVTTPAVFSGTITSTGVAPTGTLTLQEGPTALLSQPVSGTYTFSLASLPVGVHTVTVVYSGDADNTSAQSSPFTVTVQLAPTTTSLITTGSPAVLGTPVTLTAHTASVLAGLFGSVQFLDGSTVLGTATPNGGTASLTTSSLTFGPHTLSAVYTADSTHAASTSAPLAFSIVQSANVALTSSLNPANSGQTVVLTANIPAVGGVVPTGSIVFAADATPLGTVPLDSTAQARLQTANLTVGSHNVTASYAGDGSFFSGAASLVQVVRSAATTVSLTIDADPVTFGASATLTATVGSNGGPATGTVNFLEGTTLLGTGTLQTGGVASLALATLAPGRHTVTAAYVGDGRAAASASTPISFLVRQRTTLALTAGNNPALSLEGISLTASLGNAGAAPATGSIVFLENTTVLGTAALDAAGHATLQVGPMSVGTHILTATYAGDDADFATAAPALNEAVQKRLTTVALTSSYTNPADAQSVTLIAIVQSPTPASGVAPTGTVRFTTGTSTLAIAPVDAAGVATLTTRLPVGTTETVLAAYAGDDNYNAATSAGAVAKSGDASQFILAVSSPAITLQTGQRTTLTLSVASVKGFNDNLKFGCVGLPYAATCTFSANGVRLAANGTGSLQLTVDTGDPLGEGSSTSADNRRTTAAGKGIALCLLPAAVLLCCCRHRRFAPALLAVLLSVSLLLGVTGCAGLTMSSTPPGSYTFQVTALGQGTGANEAQTVTLMVSK